MIQNIIQNMYRFVSLFSIMFYVFSACLRIEMTTMAPHLVLAHKMTIIKKEEKAIKNSDDDGV